MQTPTSIVRRVSFFLGEACGCFFAEIKETWPAASAGCLLVQLFSYRVKAKNVIAQRAMYGQIVNVAIFSVPSLKVVTQSYQSARRQ